MGVFVYLLLEPNESEVRYVGVAVRPKARYQNHCAVFDGSPKSQWILDLHQRGEVPVLEIFWEVPEEFKFEAELLAIEYYEQCGARLLNRGHRGTTKSAEHRANIGASLKGLKRGPMSEEHKRKIALATAANNRRRVWTPEQRARMSEVKRAQYASGTINRERVLDALDRGRRNRVQ